jgi:YidC/Oxa1 family membrane protein insertase
VGLLNPLYDAVSWIIVQFHSLYSHIFAADSGWAWGLSIVSLVVLIRVCLIPLFVKQIKATRNMQALQPRMKAIQERYKSDKQRQSEEMMKLYKETGTNPFSSCLPIIVQSPFFFALYHVLSNIAKGNKVGVVNQHLVNSARDAHIFGAPLSAKFTDSAAKLHELGATLVDVRVVAAVMIVLMSASQFTTQRQLMTKNVDLTVKTPFMQQQKMLMYVFPVMFAVFGINFPVGVLVYWLTTNAWTMCQQLVVIRRNPTPGSKAFAERQARLKAKGKLDEPAKDGAAAGGATAVGGSTAVRRQQPKRQSKSQRQTGTGAGTGGPVSKPDLKKTDGAADSGATTDREDPEDSRPDDSGPAQPKQQSQPKQPQRKPQQPGSSQNKAAGRTGAKGQQQRKGGGKPRQPTGSRPTKK